jgi:predicted Ser/Thr protein kinase
MKRIISYLSILFFLFILSLIFAETSLAQSDFLDSDLGGVLAIIITIAMISMFFYIKDLFYGSKKFIKQISESVKDKKQKSKCPHCQILYYITENQIGKETTCKNCHKKFTIKEYIVLKRAH